ncbi:MAG: DNA-binding protein [Acidiferrobacter sp.]
MTLENLLKIGQLKSHATDATEIHRLLEAVRRNLADAHVKEVSPETRFDAAYKAIMQTAHVALMANGFRPDTNKPGHHMTVLQSLPATIGLPSNRVTVLDALRRKRNLSDYMGEDVDDVSADTCIREAEQLLREVTAWLKKKRPDLLR